MIDLQPAERRKERPAIVDALAARVVELEMVLHSASHALRSYQYGNSATDLAESVANEIDALFASAPKREGDK